MAPNDESQTSCAMTRGGTTLDSKAAVSSVELTTCSRRMGSSATLYFLTTCESDTSGSGGLLTVAAGPSTRCGPTPSKVDPARRRLKSFASTISSFDSSRSLSSCAPMLSA